MKAKVLHVFRSFDVPDSLDIGFESSIGSLDIPLGNFYIHMEEATRLADKLDAHMDITVFNIDFKTRNGYPIYVKKNGVDSGILIQIDDPQAEYPSWRMDDSEAKRLIHLIRGKN